MDVRSRESSRGGASKILGNGIRDRGQRFDQSSGFELFGNDVRVRLGFRYGFRGVMILISNDLIQIRHRVSSLGPYEFLAHVLIRVQSTFQRTNRVDFEGHGRGEIVP